MEAEVRAADRGMTASSALALKQLNRREADAARASKLMPLLPT
jgi:hypothetical protein